MEILTLIIVLIVVAVFIGNYRYGQQEAALKAQYDEALRSGDKANALTRGRVYYSHLRKGKLTLYDEQAIANDISTMK